jgi:hypothetical protein
VKRLVRERGRLVAGISLLVTAVVVLGVGYASISDEVFVSIQLPYVLGGGVGALLCAGVGLALIRSQDDIDSRRRLVDLEAAHEVMGERFQALGLQVEYVTQLLEAVLRDDAVLPVPPENLRREVRI